MAETFIHPTAVVDPEAQLGVGVNVGPYAILGPNVQIGDRVTIHPHALVDGHTQIGVEAQIFPFAAVGLRPQDLKYDGSPTKLLIGDRTVIREFTTLQPGTLGRGTGVTKIGDDCLIMAYCHVAHDCEVGNRVIMVNASQLGGHVIVEDFVTLGGVTTVHQFTRIGTRAITGASTRVVMDVPPYTTADGHPAQLHGLNTVGLKRAGIAEPTRRALKRAYRALFREDRYKEALPELEQTLAKEFPEVDHLCQFLRASTRGVTRAPRKGGAAEDAED
jgi:UDP-N-acetylglucosamine acyltransferase